MSSDRAYLSRRAALIAGGASLGLSACGFTPIYGEGAAARGLNGRIAVAQIDGKMGFAARKRLTERLGPASAASHLLTVTLDVTSDGLGISQTNQITRYNLTGEASYEVRHMGSNTRVETGDARAFAAYSASASPFATRVAEEDARARLAVTLADQIVTRLAATSATWLS